MSAFDEADARTAQAISRAFGERVQWRPKLPTPENQNFTTTTTAPDDPARPRRELDAAVTWRPTVSTATPGTGPNPGSGGVATANAALVVDFQTELFTVGKGPRRGDHLFLYEEPDPRERLVRIERVAHDGTAHIHCYCSILTAGR